MKSGLFNYTYKDLHRLTSNPDLHPLYYMWLLWCPGDKWLYKFPEATHEQSHYEDWLLIWQSGGQCKGPFRLLALLSLVDLIVIKKYICRADTKHISCSCHTFIKLLKHTVYNLLQFTHLCHFCKFSGLEWDHNVRLAPVQRTWTSDILADVSYVSLLGKLGHYTQGQWWICDQNEAHFSSVVVRGWKWSALSHSLVCHPLNWSTMLWEFPERP